MTAMDYYTLHLEMVDLYNSMFEYWLGITFAFVLAAHFAVVSMHKKLYLAMIGLYGIASAIFVFRFSITVNGATAILARIVTEGFDPAPYLPDGRGGEVVLNSIFLLMIGGSISALIFAMFLLRNRRDIEQSN